jgi:uncharacterized protein (DUF58 family)
MAESLFDKEFLARLEYLYIVTRELFVGHASAERLSKKFGVGMEFADYRSYTPGDDVRYVDWSAYARREELLVKLFTEEQQAEFFFVLDASRSMATGTPEKLFFAKKIAATLGYVALANLESVTVVVFDETLRPIGRSFEGRAQLQQLLDFLESVEARGGTATNEAIRQFVRRYGNRGMVVLLSDFLDRAGYEETFRLLHYHRHDLLALQINDREEIAPTLTGDVELVDSETGENIIVQLTPELVASYQSRMAEHYGKLTNLCKALHHGYLPAVTDTPFETLIFDVFRRGGFLR